MKRLLLLLLLATPAAAHAFKPKVLYKSDKLVVTQVAPDAFEHTSFLKTEDFGSHVPCNGLVVRNGVETAVFDTPTDDSGAAELIRWVQGTLRCRIVAVVPTHFHNDCLGGLRAFDRAGIPSYASFKTIDLAKAKAEPVPGKGFADSLRLPVGNTYVTAKFFGEGHTRDNVVGYFPEEKILFGGCLIKEIDATRGYLGDANVAAWSATVERVKAAYPDVRVVIPGHGKRGGKKLLDYTIGLFRADAGK